MFQSPQVSSVSTVKLNILCRSHWSRAVRATVLKHTHTHTARGINSQHSAAEKRCQFLSGHLLSSGNNRNISLRNKGCIMQIWEKKSEAASLSVVWLLKNSFSSMVVDQRIFRVCCPVTVDVSFTSFSVLFHFLQQISFFLTSTCSVSFI